MNAKYILISIIVTIIVIIFIVLLIILSNNSKVVIKTKTINKKNDISKKIVNIKDMVEIAAKRDSSEANLKEAIGIVAKQLQFPKKIKYRVPKEAKIYLNFVLLIASHRHCDAKMIAYMDKVVKQANPDYTREIDIYENEGLRERSRRI
ncbi:MAG: hypothetical protein GXP61_07360 [Epsilonproteobacteria bacterium]|nr:hypothetical protein [Campylobacterota bacterium]